MPSGQLSTRVNSNTAYDWDGDSLFSETFNVNGLNQVISAALGSITYDARGNTVSAGSKSYGYDVFNQLTSVSGAGTNATMIYDPVGRMASVTGTSTTTQFGYSGSQLIVEYNSSGTVLRRYVHGVGSDNPIVWYEGSGTSTRKWLMTDQQGSVTGLTNNSGVVTDKNTYNEYGVPALSNIGRFQYTGQVWLAEAQIYHYKARAYDPYLGRFLQTDPIGYADGMNMYAYVGGDPVNSRDPSGLETEECVVDPSGECIISTGRKVDKCDGDCVYRGSWQAEEIRAQNMDMEIRRVLDEIIVEGTIKFKFSCSKGWVKYGNKARSVGAYIQRLTGSATLVAMGSVSVTTRTYGWSSPVTGPLFAGSMAVAATSAVVGTAADFGGAGMQSFGTRSLKPLKEVSISYLTTKAFEKFIPKLHEATSNADSVGALTGARATTYKCPKK